MTFVPSDAPTIKVASPGSRFLHLCREGNMITFCGRVAIYRARYMPARDLCKRCVIDASKRGGTVPR